MYPRQSAVNEVYFDRYHLGLGRLQLFLLDPYQWTCREGFQVLEKTNFTMGPVILYHEHKGYGHTKKEGMVEKGFWFLGEA